MEFLILALVAYVLGARGIAGLSMNIAKWLVILFIVLAVIHYFCERYPYAEKLNDKNGHKKVLCP
jgi:uncharacterized membrane protein YtjA (UPF0391 family)